MPQMWQTEQHPARRADLGVHWMRNLRHAEGTDVCSLAQPEGHEGPVTHAESGRWWWRPGLVLTGARNASKPCASTPTCNLPDGSLRDTPYRRRGAAAGGGARPRP